MKQHFCQAEKSIITYQDKCNWCGEREGSMTQQEIIEMARQAGFKMENSAAIQAAKAFAELVHQRGYMDGWSDSDEAKTSVSFEMITNAVEAEREACAKLLESRKTGANELMDAVRDMEAKAIRARGEQA